MDDYSGGIFSTKGNFYYPVVVYWQ